jgi:hypothetical protein
VVPDRLDTRYFPKHLEKKSKFIDNYKISLLVTNDRHILYDIYDDMEIAVMFDLFEKVQDIRHIYFLHHCYLMYDEIVPMELNLFAL